MIEINEEHTDKEFVKEFFIWLIDNDYVSIDLSSYGKLNDKYELFLTLKSSTQEISFDEESNELIKFIKYKQRDERLRGLGIK